MQTQHNAPTRSSTDTADLTVPVFAAFQLPQCRIMNLDSLYKQAREYFGLASESMKAEISRIVLKCQDYNWMDDLSIQRAFNRHRRGYINEQEMLTTLRDQCHLAVAKCLPERYCDDVELSESHVSISTFDIDVLYIDTQEMNFTERFVVYSALELISLYQLPLATPINFLCYEYSNLEEVELDQIIDLACTVENVEEFVEHIESEASDVEFFAEIYCSVNEDLCEAVSLVLEYEAAQEMFKGYEQCLKAHKLLTSPKGRNRKAVIDRHCTILEKIDNPICPKLIACLKKLKEQKHNLEFEMSDIDDSQPLNYAISVIDKTFLNTQEYLTEGVMERLNQMGEPICESLPWNEYTKDRLKLLSDAHEILITTNPNE